MTNNYKKHKVSPSFIAFIIIFIALLCFFCYRVLSETGTIPKIFGKKEPEPSAQVSAVDTNKIKLAQKDSIIAVKDSEIANLKLKLEEKPDTIFVPKYIKRSDDSTRSSKPISIKVDSVK